MAAILQSSMLRPEHRASISWSNRQSQASVSWPSNHRNNGRCVIRCLAQSGDVHAVPAGHSHEASGKKIVIVGGGWAGMFVVISSKVCALPLLHPSHCRVAILQENRHRGLQPSAHQGSSCHVSLELCCQCRAWPGVTSQIVLLHACIQ